MTTFRGHYLPVVARRRVLKIYRDRRSSSTWSPFATGPLPPIEAMRATVRYFEGWLANAVAFGPVGPRQSVDDLTHEYRAAQFYLDRMYDKRQTQRALSHLHVGADTRRVEKDTA